MVAAIKFPKTPRLVSVLREPSVELYRQWKRSVAVVEEKVDGANVGIWFDEAGRMHANTLYAPYQPVHGLAELGRLRDPMFDRSASAGTLRAAKAPG